MTMAKQPKYDFFDDLADRLDIEVLMPDMFANHVINMIVGMVAPRLQLTELEKLGVISSKKAPSDPRSTGEVTTT